MSELAQLSLPVHLRDDATLDNFLFPQGSRALESSLRQLRSGDSEQFLFLYGAPGSGRSHLLQAACHERQAGDSLYLPLAELRGIPPMELLQGVETLGLLCLDDLDVVCGEADWEEALFHLFNRIREAGGQLVVSATAAPRSLPLQLEDLRSRLSWSLVFQLPEVSDEFRRAVLQFRVQRRGMQLSEESANYILNRSERSLSSLMDVLDQLDRASMAAQRPLSIPFVRETLNW